MDVVSFDSFSWVIYQWSLQSLVCSYTLGHWQWRIGACESRSVRSAVSVDRPLLSSCCVRPYFAHSCQQMTTNAHTVCEHVCKALLQWTSVDRIKVKWKLCPRIYIIYIPTGYTVTMLWSSNYSFIGSQNLIIRLLYRNVYVYEISLHSLFVTPLSMFLQRM